MQPLYYLAYGSNLHPLRLNQRVPSARLLGVTALSGYRLSFHKRHADNSAKANMLRTQRDDDNVHAALYEIDAQEKCFLDLAEGEGYRCESLRVVVDGREFDSFVYIAQPSHIDDSLVPHAWYTSIVSVGARFLDFPPDYVRAIDEVYAVPDPEPERDRTHQQLLNAMRAYRM